MKRILSTYFLIIVFFALNCQSSFANTLVYLNTSLGVVYLELFDNIAPKTVSNFLEYVNSGDYNGTIIHRSIPGFVIQTGGFRLNQDLQLQTVTSRGTIENEFQLSNTRGTIAMAKVSGDPNSATSQWFVNLADNAQNLDNQNGGFTVFGRVIADGMNVIDSIARLPRYNFETILTDTPTINYDPDKTLSQDNFVFIHQAVALTEDKNAASFGYNYLQAVVDANSFGRYQCKFRLYNSSDGRFYFVLDPDLLQVAGQDEITQATFDEKTGILTFPIVKVSNDSSVKNVVLQLVNSEQLIFVLSEIDGTKF